MPALPADRHPSPHPDADDAARAACAERAARDQRLAALLRGAAQGRADDFEAFYDATLGWARAWGRRLVRDGELEDVLAEAYLDAWRAAARFDAARGSAVSWLLTLVHHRALDLLRRRREAGGEAPEPEDEGDAADPGARLWQAEAGARLGMALAALSAPERWVLGLAYFRDLSHAAIAHATGLPLGTVKSLILRAQHKLRDQLSDLA